MGDERSCCRCPGERWKGLTWDSDYGDGHVAAYVCLNLTCPRRDSKLSPPHHAPTPGPGQGAQGPMHVCVRVCASVCVCELSLDSILLRRLPSFWA